MFIVQQFTFFLSVYTTYLYPLLVLYMIRLDLLALFDLFVIFFFSSVGVT